MTMPDFVIIGAAKCASTSLAAALSRHPGIFMPVHPTTNFFSRDDRYAQGLAVYQQRFEDAGPDQRVGEGTPQYSMAERFPDTVERMHRHLPDIQLIYIVRDPIRRMESLWSQDVQWGLKPGIVSFPQAVRELADAYIAPSRYAQQLERYRALYPDERIQVVFYEDFVRDPAAVAAGLFHFLGVDPEAAPGMADLHLNPSEKQRQDRPLVRRLRASRRFRRFYGRFKAAAPWLVQRIPAALYRERFTQRVRWDAATYQWAREQVEAEAREFLGRYGRSRDFWTFEPREPLVE